jgi:carboxymethylenebutenolidase
VIPALTAALGEAGVIHEVEQIPGTLHGYCFAERQVYNPLASEQSWSKLFAMWARTLQQKMPDAVSDWENRE